MLDLIVKITLNSTMAHRHTRTRSSVHFNEIVPHSPLPIILSASASSSSSSSSNSRLLFSSNICFSRLDGDLTMVGTQLIGSGSNGVHYQKVERLTDSEEGLEIEHIDLRYSNFDLFQKSSDSTGSEVFEIEEIGSNELRYGTSTDQEMFQRQDWELAKKPDSKNDQIQQTLSEEKPELTDMISASSEEEEEEEEEEENVLNQQSESVMEVTSDLNEVSPVSYASKSVSDDDCDIDTMGSVESFAECDERDDNPVSVPSAQSNLANEVESSEDLVLIQKNSIDLVVEPASSSDANPPEMEIESNTVNTSNVVESSKEGFSVEKMEPVQEVDEESEVEEEADQDNMIVKNLEVEENFDENEKVTEFFTALRTATIQHFDHVSENQRTFSESTLEESTQPKSLLSEVSNLQEHKEVVVDQGKIENDTKHSDSRPQFDQLMQSSSGTGQSEGQVEVASIAASFDVSQDAAQDDHFDIAESETKSRSEGEAAIESEEQVPSLDEISFSSHSYASSRMSDSLQMYNPFDGMFGSDEGNENDDDKIDTAFLNELKNNLSFPEVASFVSSVRELKPPDLSKLEWIAKLIVYLSSDKKAIVEASLAELAQLGCIDDTSEYEDEVSAMRAISAAFECGAHSSIIGAMNKWYEFPEVQILGCRALHNFGINKNFRDAAGKLGAFETLLQALRNFPGNVELQKLGSACLCCLSAEKHMAKYFVLELNGLKSILRIMKQHASDEFVQLWCCSAINYMSNFPELKQKICESGTLQVLFFVIQKFTNTKNPDHCLIQNQAREAMKRLL